MNFDVRNDRLYQNGTPVHRVRTGRKSRGSLPSNPDLVIHYTVGENFDSMVRALSAEGSGHGSSHIVLGREGEIAQVEDFKARLWHAGTSYWKGRKSLNSASIGIEVCCQGWLNERNEAGLWRQRSGRYRSRWFDVDSDKLKIGKHPDRSVFIRTYGPGTQPNVCAWPGYTGAQMAVLKELVPMLVDFYNVRDVVGHDEISPGRKQDPGLCIDRTWLMLWDQHAGSNPDPKPKSTSHLTLRRSDKGRGVVALQKQLYSKGFVSVGMADGDFGPKTHNAVLDFQRANNLTVDGIVGPKTNATLFGE